LTAKTSAERPLRADAARNRAKVIDGARKAFRRHGLDADMAEVARQAGVGVGTVYRHFPTKEALTKALAVDHFEHLAAMTDQALAAEDGDAWAVFEALIWQTAEETAEDLGMCEVLGESTTIAAKAESGTTRLQSTMFELLERAKAQGAIRQDVTAIDVPMIMCGFGQVRVKEAHGAGFDWRRYLTIALDGLRAR
jgi:AcrR family transcriptional regulator